MFVVIASPTTTNQLTAPTAEERRPANLTVNNDETKANDNSWKSLLMGRQIVKLCERVAKAHRSFIGWGLDSGPKNVYLRDRAIARVIFYAKVMILTEIFSLLNG